MTPVVACELEYYLVDARGGQVDLAAAPEWEASNFGAHLNDLWSALAHRSNRQCNQCHLCY